MSLSTFLPSVTPYSAVVSGDKMKQRLLFDSIILLHIHLHCQFKGPLTGPLELDQNNAAKSTFGWPLEDFRLPLLRCIS